MINRKSILRVVGESVLIVVSVLVALSADAWLQRLQERAKLEEHVVALSRDFAQMRARATTSFDIATRASDSGRKLLAAIYAGDINSDSTRYWFGRTLSHEVFSPSVGAYQALVATGSIEILPDPALKLALGEFFGSFEDMRVSERLLVDTQERLLRSSTFTDLAGMHRSGAYGIPMSPAGPASMATWADSPEMMNAIGLLIMRHADVRSDYRFLIEQIESIEATLAALGADGSDS